MNTPTPELSPKPCPFCNSTPSLVPYSIGFQISCQNKECGINPKATYTTTELSIAAWNRRSSQPAVEEPSYRTATECRLEAENMHLKAEVNSLSKQLAHAAGTIKASWDKSTIHELREENELLRKENEDLNDQCNYNAHYVNQYRHEVKELSSSLDAARKRFQKIASMCGNPDAAQACRDIIAVIREVVQTNGSLPSSETGDCLPKSDSNSIEIEEIKTSASCAAEEVQQSKQSEQPNAEECLEWLSRNGRILWDDDDTYTCYNYSDKPLATEHTPLAAIRSAMSTMKSGGARRYEYRTHSSNRSHNTSSLCNDMVLLYRLLRRSIR